MDKVELNNNYNQEDFDVIKSRFINKMRMYDIDFQEKDEIAIDLMINALINRDLDRDRFTYVISASCGMGKSTLLDIYINYMLEKFNNNYGAIIAKERIEDIIKYTQESSKQETHYPLYGFKKEDCSIGRNTFNPNACRVCKVEDCRVKQNKYEVENYPILVTTHARIQLAESLWFLQEQLIKYMHDTGDRKTESNRRHDLFIDENPVFYELNMISISEIDIFVKELHNTYRRECKNKQEVIKYFTEKINEVKIKLNESHMYFDGIVNTKEDMKEFRKYEDMFNYNYYGDEFIKCLNIMSIIKYGGKIVDSTIVFPLYRSLQGLPFNKIIFDATSPVNMSYPAHSCKLIEIPETRSFDNVTINWCSNNNLSKSYYEEHPETLNNVVNYVAENINGHKKILFVTFKDMKEDYQDMFSMHDIEDKLLISHVNGTKGRNDLAEATCVFVGYNLYKGDDFYLFGQHYNIEHIPPENIVFNSHGRKRTAYIVTDEIDNQGNKIMKLSKEIDEFIVKDRSVDLIQEVFRTAVRKYNNKERIDIYLFNTDERVIKTLYDFLPGSHVVEWKPFETRKKSKQYDEYISAFKMEFSNKESGYDISTSKFKNKYSIKNRTFAGYQKNDNLNEYIMNEYNVVRRGNFLVKI